MPQRRVRAPVAVGPRVSQAAPDVVGRALEDYYGRVWVVEQLHRPFALNMVFPEELEDDRTPWPAKRLIARGVLCVYGLARLGPGGA